MITDRMPRRPGMRRLRVAGLAVTLLTAACSTGAGNGSAGEAAATTAADTTTDAPVPIGPGAAGHPPRTRDGSTTTATPTSTTTTFAPITTPNRATTTTVTTTTTGPPTSVLRGRVVSPEGEPLPGAVVTAGGERTTTGEKGRFRIEGLPPGEIRIARPAWRPRRIDWEDGGLGRVTLEPRIVRGLRATPDVAGDPDRYRALLDLTERTRINTLVFDTKDETGRVRYATEVPKAKRLGAIAAAYDPAEALDAADERGLYTIARVVTFEDAVWSAGDPAARLAGSWVDPVDRDNWSYPLALAVEACRTGFDEVQFDYVRFPTGSAADEAEERRPTTRRQRTGTIRDFLGAARDRLHEAGCAVSADIFGIVVSTSTDQGIGQHLETLSPMVDAVSPMVYPSHYATGWLGFDDPNDHPGRVTAGAIEDADRRLHPTTVLRPWLQGFWWSDGQIRASVRATEDRGHGWIIWNAAGEYRAGSLPGG